MGFYNQTGGNSLYDYNPYNITITKGGYTTYTTQFTFDEQTDWTITLTPEVQQYPAYYWAVAIGIIAIVAFVLYGKEKWK